MGTKETLESLSIPFSSPLVLEVKQEISRVLKSPLFRQAPKLCSLLEYVCLKALLQEGENVTEYTIAIDVFGKPLDFKERKDSSVRVEVYRLRKRLALFYENDGRDHPIRIVIPHGHYAPEFTFTEVPLNADLDLKDASETTNPLVVSNAPSEIPEVASECESRVEPSSVTPISAEVRPRKMPVLGSIIPGRSWRWIALVTGFVVAAAALAGIWLNRVGGRGQAAVARASVIPTQSRASAGPATGSSAFSQIRIMAGYTGPLRRDISGAEWGPDRYFHGGRGMHRDVAHTGRTNDPLLFENSRVGDCTYDIPLPPGDYELHLYFSEPEFGPEVGRGENDRTFFLHLNTTRMSSAIDIESEAMGPNIADERVFKDIHPAADGKLHIGFESGTGVPLVNAIEVVQGLPHAQLPVRLGTHPVPLTDHLGKVWQADNYYLNGQTCPRNQGVTGTPDPALFALERYGHFDYAIPVDVRGQYTLMLHFAEFYFGPSAPGRGGVGSRVFNVMCNGVLLLQNLDIFREAGNGHALTKTAYHLKPTAQGKLNITFEPVINYALIYGIEVLDESK